MSASACYRRLRKSVRKWPPDKPTLLTETFDEARAIRSFSPFAARLRTSTTLICAALMNELNFGYLDIFNPRSEVSFFRETRFALS